MEDSIDKDNLKYLEIKKNHTDRLINIVGDLMTVSQLEDNNVKINLSEVDLKKLFKDFFPSSNPVKNFLHWFSAVTLQALS